jgi:hypothetical protein
VRYYCYSVILNLRETSDTEDLAHGNLMIRERNPPVHLLVLEWCCTVVKQGYFDYGC